MELTFEDMYTLLDRNGKPYLSKAKGTLGGYKLKKIYGKLNCPSALRYLKKGQYKPEVRVFFENEKTAKTAGYRPCAKCLPEKYKKWKEEEKILDKAI